MSPGISIGVVAFKGGVGKTTIAAGLAEALSRAGTVLLVDGDSQQSATSARLAAVATANQAGEEGVTFGSVYPFNQTRLDTESESRTNTYQQLQAMAQGVYHQLPDKDSDGNPLTPQTPLPPPSVLVVDSPPASTAIAAGLADYLVSANKGSLLVATSPNDLEIGNAIQTIQQFKESHPTLQTWLVLNQVTNRADHIAHRDSLTALDSQWRTLSTVIPARAEIARMFRHERMGTVREAAYTFNSLANELQQFWVQPPTTPMMDEATVGERPPPPAAANDRLVKEGDNNG